MMSNDTNNYTEKEWEDFLDQYDKGIPEDSPYARITGEMILELYDEGG